MDSWRHNMHNVAYRTTFVQPTGQQQPSTTASMDMSYNQNENNEMSELNFACQHMANDSGYVRPSSLQVPRYDDDLQSPPAYTYPEGTQMSQVNRGEEYIELNDLTNDRERRRTTIRASRRSKRMTLHRGILCLRQVTYGVIFVFAAIAIILIMLLIGIKLAGVIPSVLLPNFEHIIIALNLIIYLIGGLCYFVFYFLNQKIEKLAQENSAGESV